MFPQEYLDFGYVCKASVSGDAIKIHRDNFNSQIIYVSQPIEECRWSGNRILVELASGEVRMYYGFGVGDYDIVKLY